MDRMLGNKAQEICEDTLLKFLLRSYREYPDRVCMRKKRLGKWEQYNWGDCYQNIKKIALGLISLGLKRGDKVVIIGDNDPEYVWMQLAVQAMGGVTVGIYTDTIPSELQYLTLHCEATFAIAKDQEQVDKFLKIKDNIPRIKRIIYWDSKGMWAYQDVSLLMFFQQVIELGEKHVETHPNLFEESIEKVRADDIAVISYTSGTTGLPKGAMIDHRHLVEGAKIWESSSVIREGDDYVSFISPAWLTEQLFLPAMMIYNIKYNFPEKPETVQENIREIAPQSVLWAPRQWESSRSMVQVKMDDSAAIKRLIYNICLAIGYKVVDFRLKYGRQPGLFWLALYKLADWCCLKPIRDRLGLVRARCAVSGGAAMGSDLFRWYQAIGVYIKDTYGLTELAPWVIHEDRFRWGTQGRTQPGTTIRISDEGEILGTSDTILFRGYYKQPDETARMLDGKWLKTGDAGIINEAGELIVLDRIKDMLVLKGGAKYSPTYIENRLKFSIYVKDVMVVGGEDKEYIFGIIFIDFENVGKWAERKWLSYTTLVDLSQKEEVYDLIQKEMERVNATLPPPMQIKKYAIMHKDLDPDEGELTRTRKLRRSFMEERVKDLIEAAYAGQTQITTKADVKYRDGRTGSIETAIKIKSIKKDTEL